MKAHPKHFKELTGQVFGRLRVLEFNSIGRGGKALWNCVCECGNTTTVYSDKLRRGCTKSCGCLKLNVNRSHGMHKSPEYTAWAAMKSRCTNPKTVGYHNYGGRGISVCERWLNSFEAFISDMGKRPSSKHSIDRIDNDGNYEPGNCRWTVMIVQRNNTRLNVRVEFRGENLTLSEWGRRFGVSSTMIARRIRNGWPIEQAMITPSERAPKATEAKEAVAKTAESMSPASV